MQACMFCVVHRHHVLIEYNRVFKNKVDNAIFDNVNDSECG